MELRHIDFEIANACNASCPHCFHENLNRQHTYLSLDDVKRIIDEAIPLGLESVTVTGGEPCLNSEWKEILRYVDDHAIRIDLFSNCTLLHEDDFCFLEQLKKLRYVQTTIYSFDANTHDKVMGIKGAHTKTLSSIKEFRSKGIPFYVSVPLFKMNLDDAVSTYCWLLEQGIPFGTNFFMTGGFDFRNDNLRLRIDSNELKKLFDDIRERKPDLLYLFNPPAYRDPDTTLFYECGADSLCISADGKVYPCIGWNHCLDNIRNSSFSVKDTFYTNPLLQKIREIYISDMKECMSCSSSHFCDFFAINHLNHNKGSLFLLDKDVCEFIAFKQKLFQSIYAMKMATVG